MKAVAYSIRSFEREFLAKANGKKHDITLITNQLGLETASYAEGKQVVIIGADDEVNATVIHRLAASGVNYLISRSSDNANIDAKALLKCDIKMRCVITKADPNQVEPDSRHIADQIIQCLNDIDKEDI